ncbi:MAG: calcium-translocating P-type ATPase, PMCA-type [Oscillospiraceae bacterium]|nr:calcium-translocating P-type ATPase, PMCA-type [Oscillospiraceae bacterium]
MTPISAATEGLTALQVERSRLEHGTNQLSMKKRRGFFDQFLESFGDPIIKVLLVALFINILFLFRSFDWYDSAGIAIAIFLATFVSTLSEYGSESAFAKLQEDAGKIRCRVRRSGRIAELPISDIVTGDIVILQAGDRIPADGLLIEGDLKVDQSALNGESREATKTPGDGGDSRDFLSKNHLFRGSIVCSGQGLMRVSRVGDSTFYGRLAGEVQEETRESPLKVRLGQLAKTLSHIGYLSAILVAVADLFNSLLIKNGMNIPLMIRNISQSPHLLFEDVLHAITLAITVVVVAVPEGLPMMITVVLSSNMRRMLKDNVLVRKLVGIETSGSLNILFSDKTGTLTRGQLEVTHLITGDCTEYKAEKIKLKKPLWELIELSCSYNTAGMISGSRIVGGNATDRALLKFVTPVSAGLKTRYVRADGIPFDSSRKFSLARVKASGTKNNISEITLVKGAPERILPHCTRYYNDAGKVCALPGRLHLENKMKEMTCRAIRVLALAVSETTVDERGSFSRLILIGLIGIRDEVRPEAREAICQVRDAGIQIVLITGDNRETAAAIAKEVGLINGKNTDQVITSAQLALMNDNELKKRLPMLRVVARALPADKSRLVRLSQELGLVAGMTGDGINDAPALKKADVGFSMGSGTEVAKEAGDIVILDDNIASIAKAVLYGRTIFKSIRKFIIFQLTMNLCAVGVSIIGPFIGIDTPVTVIQMLWINIIMDTLAGLAIAGEPPLAEYMNEPPKRRGEPVLNRYMLHQILCMGIFTVILCVLFLKLPFIPLLFRYAGEEKYFMTAFFTLFIFAGVFNSFNARTHRINLFAHLRRNPLFLLIMFIVAVVQLLLIYYGGSLFRTAGLSFGELRTVLLMAFMVVPADGVRKLVLRLFGRKGTL